MTGERAAEPVGATGHRELMDRIYASQRHVYDFTRKYYLFGRDRTIAGLNARQGANVLEIGCGTGRNLDLIRRRWPGCTLYGIDISAEMLKTASAKLGSTARLAVADATCFDPLPGLGRSEFDRIVMSYCTSMIPEWRAAVAHASTLLAPGGSLHIVDFGGMRGLPSPLRVALQWWLRLFHVHPREDLIGFAAHFALGRGLIATASFGAGGYYQRVVIRRG